MQVFTSGTRALSSLRKPFVTQRYASTITQGLLNELESRGFVAATTSPGLSKQLDAGPTGVYVGFDPSASSLHVGNLLPLICLLHFKQTGHHALALVCEVRDTETNKAHGIFSIKIGGATGFIGDPSGRSSERQALDPDQLAHNVKGITAQVNSFFERGHKYARKRGAGTAQRGALDILNNLDWTGEITLLDFLKGVGKRSKVNAMLARDSVKNRLSTEQGISFTEFSYQLLQAYDFKVLHDRYNCKVQLGGSDQWGNIVSGIDMIRRMKNADTEGQEDADPHKTREEMAYGLTIPLLTTSNGEKFGKSAGNAVWLDSSMTSVFDFYQYFLRSTDSDVPRLLRLFTFLSLEEIEAVVQEHQAKPSARIGQKKLAAEVTELVHGFRHTARAQIQSTVLFDSDMSKLRPEDILDALSDDVDRFRLVEQDTLTKPLSRIVLELGMAKSKGEVSRMAASGGLYLNGKRVTDSNMILTKDNLLKEKFCVIGMGKTEKKILYLLPQPRVKEYLSVQ